MPRNNFSPSFNLQNNDANNNNQFCLETHNNNNNNNNINCLYLIAIFVVNHTMYCIFAMNQINTLYNNNHNNNNYYYYHFFNKNNNKNFINEQCVVYHFKCGLREMDYVGFTNQHLFQHINEHTNSRSSIGKHMKLQHGVQ